MEERNLKKKILIVVISIALLTGLLSGCTEEITEEEEEEEEPTNTAPTAAFTPSTLTPAAAEDITFTDGSADEDENDTLTYSWNFGDDIGTSTNINPIYNYSENGTYSVTLTVSDGTDTATATATIIVGNVAPIAAFVYTITNLTVDFTDDSQDLNGDTLTYLWDFGDENTNDTQNPIYTYDTAGTYNVTLTVTDIYGLTDATDILAIIVTE